MIQKSQQQVLVETLAEDEGLLQGTYEDTTHTLLETYGLDSVVPGICRECLMVHSRTEPDLGQGHCEGCGEKKVVSVTRLLGVI